MPTYTYKCGYCEHEFDEVRSISEMREPELEACIKCHQRKIQKVITSAPRLTSSVNLKNKIPHAFKDRLREIKKDRAGTNIDHLI